MIRICKQCNTKFKGRRSNKFCSQRHYWDFLKKSGIKPPSRKGVKSPRAGNKAWNWKGGITPERKKAYFSKEYKQWRSDVFQRDNWTCQTCGARGYVEAHHIKDWARFPQLRYVLDNGVALCRECHKLTDNFGYKGRRDEHTNFPPFL